MCSLRCCTSMDLCELRAVHEHERQPVAHIGVEQRTCVQRRNPGFDVFKDHENMGKQRKDS